MYMQNVKTHTRHIHEENVTTNASSDKGQKLTERIMRVSGTVQGK